MSTATPAVPVAAPAARVASIDVVRGLVMVVMALDHIREFFTPTLVRPEDVSQASAVLFFTRWVTHFCAPTFVLLSGLGVWLYQQKRGSRGATSRFLLTRGLWLIGMELVVINGLLQWWHYDLLLLQVIWAMGWGMVLLAGLLWLPRPVLIGLAALILLGHDALPLDFAVTPANAGLALLRHAPQLLPLGPGLPPLLAAYSILPWLGVMLAGYLLGPWLQLPPAPRRRRWLLAGAGLLALFVVLRLANVYGDPSPWSVQARGGFYTLLSVLNVSKYPPSLLFCCLTLGTALVLLGLSEGATGWLARVLGTYGAVPFFYYLLHFVLISSAAWVWSRLAFGAPFNFSFASPKDWPAGYQPSLGRAYLVWAGVVLALYLPCRWYRGYKQRHRYWWLSYL